MRRFFSCVGEGRFLGWLALGLSALGGSGCGKEAGLPPDPLASRGDRGGELTDVSPDLDALLEHGRLLGACGKMQPGDRASRLLCGKSMFFDESFGTLGVPASLVQFLLENFPAEIGAGFAHLGMIPDPRSPKHLPLGMVATAKLGGKIDALAFTCASCHLGRLPDGRYAVGAPNERYQYGKHILSLAVFPSIATGGEKGHHQTVLSALQPLMARYQADPSLPYKLIVALLPLIGGSIPAMSAASEAEYAAWKPGTMDFLAEPLPNNDGAHTVSKISPLWELPEDEEVKGSGMMHALLGWTGDTRSLHQFAQGFVAFGGGMPAAWPDEKLAPLLEYVYSLRRPMNPTPPEAVQVAEGRRVFVARGCLTCHDGPRGSGKQSYSYDEMGTDRAMQRWLDPTLSGAACCGAPFPAGETLSHGIKSPRLVGTWALSRFLHNGAVDSLERLFCLDGSRPTRQDEPFGDQGHMQTCDGLSEGEKRALLAYLRAN